MSGKARYGEKTYALDLSPVSSDGTASADGVGTTLLQPHDLWDNILCALSESLPKEKNAVGKICLSNLSLLAGAHLLLL